MDGSQAIARARSRLDEVTARFWTDAELLVWLNEAVRDVARRSETFQTQTTIAVVAGDQDYNLPADLLRLTRVEFVETGDTSVYTLDYRDINNMDEVWWTRQADRQGRPAFYTMWGGVPVIAVKLWPVPETTGELRVWYYGIPGEISIGLLGESVYVANGWEDLVIDYMEYLALRKQRDSRWQEAKQLYEEKITGLIEKTRRWTDQGGVMSYGTNPGYLPSWLVDG